jgi:hypothetical protein
MASTVFFFWVGTGFGGVSVYLVMRHVYKRKVNDD